jgi:thiol:disulfide interchange protein DsbC
VIKVLMASLAVLLAAANAFADDARIRSVVEAKLGGVRIEGIEPAPVAGLYEVRYVSRDGPQVVYTDANADHIFVGTLYDARTDRNLTEERLHKLLAIDFSTLPLDLAVKVKRGNGRRVLAMFSDPHCPYCRRFEQVLAQIDDITVYYFMYPVIHPELIAHSKAVWCAPDRAKAWLALAAQPAAQVPKSGTNCDTPIERILELGRRLHVNATPTLFLATGERVSGGLHAPELVALLDEAARQTRKK